MKQVSNIKVTYETLVIIWGALLVSQIVFLLLIYFIKPELFPFDLSRPILGERPITVLLFAASALTVFILSFLLRNQHIRRSVIDQDAGCVQTALVLGCALSELSSFLGVVLALAFDYSYFFLWIALGMVGVLLHFPRRNTLRAAGYRKFDI